jgi:hypothetical protein
MEGAPQCWMQHQIPVQWYCQACPRLWLGPTSNGVNSLRNSCLYPNPARIASSLVCSECEFELAEAIGTSSMTGKDTQNQSQIATIKLSINSGSDLIWRQWDRCKDEAQVDADLTNEVGMGKGLGRVLNNQENVRRNVKKRAHLSLGSKD